MKKILVVDDSRTIRTMCEWIYKGLEDRILTAASAAEARAVMDRESPEVVIVDYTLPDTDSYEFVSSIKSKAHVIMMGGTYAPFSADRALESGAVAVLMKPFKTDDFFRTVDEAASALKSSGAAAALRSSDHNIQAVPPIASRTSSISGITAAPAANPFAGAKRFNFPTNPPSTELPAQPGTPAAPVSSPRIVLTPASSTSNLSIQPHAEPATPKTPVPSVSPAIQAGQQIDPAALRAEVIAAVKSLLPAIVNSYLKKLIQAEVKPQLQNWVDTRVESLINKVMKP